MSRHRTAVQPADPTECAPWPWALNVDGYGRVMKDGRRIAASRWVWEQAHGPVPPGKQVLHRCSNRACVSLAHLFLGTPKDNMRMKIALRRDRGPAAENRAKLFCKRGHILDTTNVYVQTDARGYRHRRCRACMLEHGRRWRKAHPGRASRGLKNVEANPSSQLR